MTCQARREAHGQKNERPPGDTNDSRPWAPGDAAWHARRETRAAACAPRCDRVGDGTTGTRNEEGSGEI